MKLLIVLVCGFLLVNKAVYSQNIFEKIGKGFGDAACVATVLAKSGHCSEDFNKEVESRNKKDTDEKIWCCAVRALRDCVSKVAKQECDKDSEKVANSVISDLQRAVTSDECADYGFIQCITIVQIIIAAAIALGVLLLLSCVCCCCCCGKRRGRPV